MQNATHAVFNKIRVAIKKTDYATRGSWTPGKYDVVCSAHNDISRTLASQSVGIIMLDVFQC